MPLRRKSGTAWRAATHEKELDEEEEAVEVFGAARRAVARRVSRSVARAVSDVERASKLTHSPKGRSSASWSLSCASRSGCLVSGSGTKMSRSGSAS